MTILAEGVFGTLQQNVGDSIPKIWGQQNLVIFDTVALTFIIF